MKVELYYFDGCPSYHRALENLKSALHLGQLPDKVEMIEVAAPAEAQPKRFIGSPTIRIDGTDVEGAAAEANGYAHGCPLYTGDGGTAGWPSVEKIRQALRNEHRA